MVRRCRLSCKASVSRNAPASGKRRRPRGEAHAGRLPSVYDDPIVDASEAPSALGAARARPFRLRPGLLALIVACFGLSVLWVFHEPVFNRLGRLLVEETPLAQADLVVVLGDNEVSAAATAADILGKGYAPQVLLFQAGPTPGEAWLDRLSIRVPTRHELAIMVMQRMGVNPGNILVEPIAETGTNAVVRATARYARSHDAHRIIAITYRSHTRRTAILLRGALDPSSVIIVRAAPDDPFELQGWWRERGNSREFLIESMRWVNSFWFGDFWRRRE